MSNKPYDLTAPAVVDFMRNLFRTLAERYGGAATLNELRVMNQVILCRLNGRSCNVTALHKVTCIPKPTISRVVANLQDDGYLSDRRDPDDGRKRIISIGPSFLELVHDDIDGAIRWINDFREHGRPA
jgi:DNA-binding MarR family transcriptional regulator